MEYDESNIQQNWYSPGTIVFSGCSYVVNDLFVRWNENIIIREREFGPETIYTYYANRLNVVIPGGISGSTDIYEYIESIKDELIEQAQNMG